MENGILRLPVGFRFKPTDQELILGFLKPKIQSLPLSYPIPLADVNKTDPWSLPGDLEEERYFFSVLQMKYSTSNRCDRTAQSGYWKANSTDQKIFDTENHQIGSKKTLVFYKNKRPKAMKTNWVMHEYKMTNPIQGVETWTVCRLFRKKCARNGVVVHEHEEMVQVRNTGSGSSGPRNFDLNLDAGACGSSCGSSGVGGEEEEISI